MGLTSLTVIPLGSCRTSLYVLFRCVTYSRHTFSLTSSSPYSFCLSFRAFGGPITADDDDDDVL
jgi:hypothetical protein